MEAVYTTAGPTFRKHVFHRAPPPTPPPPDIQLRVQDGLCEVDPDDILSDLVSNDGQVYTE